MTDQQKQQLRADYLKKFSERFGDYGLQIDAEREAFNRFVELIKPALLERRRVDVRFDDVREIYYFPAASPRVLRELLTCLFYVAAERGETVRDTLATLGLVDALTISKLLFSSYLEDGFEKEALVAQTSFYNVADELGERWSADGERWTIKVGENDQIVDYDPEIALIGTETEK